MTGELEGECLGCGERFDHRNDVCPHCGWDRQAWVEAGRYGLDADRPGTGTWED